MSFRCHKGSLFQAVLLRLELCLHLQSLQRWMFVPALLLRQSRQQRLLLLGQAFLSGTFYWILKEVIAAHFSLPLLDLFLLGLVVALELLLLLLLQVFLSLIFFLLSLFGFNLLSDLLLQIFLQLLLSALAPSLALAQLLQVLDLVAQRHFQRLDALRNALFLVLLHLHFPFQLFPRFLRSTKARLRQGLHALGALGHQGTVQDLLQRPAADRTLHTLSAKHHLNFLFLIAACILFRLHLGLAPGLSWGGAGPQLQCIGAFCGAQVPLAVLLIGASAQLLWPMHCFRVQHVRDRLMTPKQLAGHQELLQKLLLRQGMELRQRSDHGRCGSLLPSLPGEEQLESFRIQGLLQLLSTLRAISFQRLEAQ
mmetsp:Transcript_28983/g.46844  ORF Transcript_28983/g.46844 Transcript_28983/m.46844 type:complete len:367 (+) Transcript_28983:195-1295(+)